MNDSIHEIHDSLKSGGYQFEVLPTNHWVRQFHLAHGINPDPGDQKGALLAMATKPPSASPERELWVEVGRLVQAAQDGGYGRAYLVLCGEEWTLHDNNLTEALVGVEPPPEVHILWPADIVARLMAGRL